MSCPESEDLFWQIFAYRELCRRRGNARSVHRTGITVAALSSLIAASQVSFGLNWISVSVMVTWAALNLALAILSRRVADAVGRALDAQRERILTKIASLTSQNVSLH